MCPRRAADNDTMRALAVALCLHLLVAGTIGQTIPIPKSQPGADQGQQQQGQQQQGQQGQQQAPAAAPNAAGAKAASEFKQCGGASNCAGRGGACADAQWPDVQCSPGYVCDRQNAFYWQCTNDPEVVAKARGGAAPAAVAAPGADMAGAPAAPLPVARDDAAADPGLGVFSNPRAAPQPAVDAPAAEPAAVEPADADATAAVAAPAAAAVAAAPPRPAYPGIRAGKRNESDPAALTCACIDAGINDPTCFSGITAYCESAKPNMTVCEAMSGFFNAQNVTAGKVVANFFVDACNVEIPANATACACLDGPTTDGCKAAVLSACSLGAPSCPALAFGSEADQKSRNAFNAFAQQNCDAAATTASVALKFPGVSKADFEANYAKGTAAAIADVAGADAKDVSAVAIRETGGAPAIGAAAPKAAAAAAPAAGTRKLLQQAASTAAAAAEKAVSLPSSFSWLALWCCLFANQRACFFLSRRRCRCRVH